MRKTILKLSPSFTASTTTEMLVMQVQQEDESVKFHFVEYPTNLPPSHYNLETRGNFVKDLTEEESTVVYEAFLKLNVLLKTKPFLHAPTYIIAYCEGKGLVDLNIL